MKRRKTFPSPDEANSPRQERQQARTYDKRQYDKPQQETGSVA